MTQDFDTLVAECVALKQGDTDFQWGYAPDVAGIEDDGRKYPRIEVPEDA